MSACAKIIDVSEVLQDWLGSSQVLLRQARASDKELQDVESEIGHRLPEPLRQLLLTSGGPEGFFGESYIAFFNSNDIAECWRQAQQMASGFVPDPHALSILDRIVDDEERWQTLGMIAGVVLIVAHTWKHDDDGEVIRVIFARKATPRERRAYAKNQQRPS